MMLDMRFMVTQVERNHCMVNSLKARTDPAYFS